MTIKTQGGKVITKDGKASCACCGAGECCMYPAQALADGLYTIDDLPDEIIGDGTTYNKLNPPENSSPGLAYYLANNSQPIGSGDEDVIIITGDNWVRWTGGNVGGPGQCLINSLDGEPQGISERFEDQFADIYTFSAVGMTPPSVQVTRVSLCRWELFEPDPEGGGRYWILEYANDRREGALWFFSIPSVGGGYKIGNQNTPVGNYLGIALPWNGAIS